MKKVIDKTKIIETLKPSNLYAVMSVCKELLIAISFTFMAVYFHPAFILVGVLVSFIGFIKFLKVLNIEYYITEETIIVKKGIIARSINNLELYRIKDYEVSQSAYMRVFNIMNIKLITTDVTNPILIIKGVETSYIIDKLRELVQKARNNNRIYETI